MNSVCSSRTKWHPWCRVRIRSKGGFYPLWHTPSCSWGSPAGAPSNPLPCHTDASLLGPALVSLCPQLFCHRSKPVWKYLLHAYCLLRACLGFMHWKAGRAKLPLDFRTRTKTRLKCCCLNFKVLFSVTWLCDLPLFVINLIPQVTVQWIHILFEFFFFFVWSSLKLFEKQLHKTIWELLIYNLQHRSTTSFSFG